MPFMLGAAGIGVAGNLLGGWLGGNAASKAGNRFNTVAQNVGSGLNTLGQAGYTEIQNLENPYLQAGGRGATGLEQGYAPGGYFTQQFSFDPSQIAKNPNYQFVLQQGTDAVQKSAAAQGGLFSGGTLKALDQYSQGLATQTINDAYAQALNTFQTNRNNMFQGLTTLAGLGQSGIGQLQNAQGLRANLMEAGSNAYLQGAEAQFAGAMGKSNAWTNALGGAAGIAAGTLMNPNFQNWANGGGGWNGGSTSNPYSWGSGIGLNPGGWGTATPPFVPPTSNPNPQPAGSDYTGLG